MERSPEEILDAMLETGDVPGAPDVAALCRAAIDGARAEARFDAVERALRGAGFAVIDVTNDDSDHDVELEIIRMEEA